MIGALLIHGIFPPYSQGTTAEASRRSGLPGEGRVNAGGGARHAHGPVKFGNAAGGAGGVRVPGKLRSHIGLLSRRIRDAFSAQSAEDPTGDYPPASDCWPMAALNDEAVARHALEYVAGPTVLSPGKSPAFTATAPKGSRAGDRGACTGGTR